MNYVEVRSCVLSSYDALYMSCCKEAPLFCLVCGPFEGWKASLSLSDCCNSFLVRVLPYSFPC